ncbi:MAG TPA: nucleotidyl transferase AbiEii/AbiGii toxin family protein [Woeseiaceae bacterium]|nr:nucleotidyl transferase AbiEii/AbiGii toxin family protein [Woeseiaceae bacterium]
MHSAEPWFALGRADRLDALEYAAARSGRPTHLLEKDIWVVWTLAAIYDSPIADAVTFKGGTSLSKVYKAIDRFSEDIDLTYDIRSLVPDLLREGNPIPASASQGKKITRAVRARLPEWIEKTVRPVIEAALDANGLQADVRLAGENRDKLIVAYPAVKTGTGYVSATVQLEFGARATGEPHAFRDVACDIASWIEDVAFPTARPLVMSAERTFWEKATAAHVYCHQQRLRGERYSRHWYDLAALARTEHFEKAAADRELAHQVARHKSMFFVEKDANGRRIDYFEAVRGSLKLIPEGASYTALAEDFAAMSEDGMLMADHPELDAVLDACAVIQDKVNRLA